MVQGLQSVTTQKDILAQELTSSNTEIHWDKMASKKDLLSIGLESYTTAVI